MPEPNGPVHSFDRRWTSTAEDAFLSLPYAFETPAPEDISSFDPRCSDPHSAQESASFSSQRYGASQPGCESLFGIEPEPGGESFISFGRNFDDGPLISDAGSYVDFNSDLNTGFDHSSQSSFSFSDRPCATPHSHDPTTGAPSSLEAFSISRTLPPSLPSSFSPYSSLSNTLSLGPTTNCAPPNRLLLADDPQPERLALPPAPILRCSTCSRPFASKTRLM